MMLAVLLAGPAEAVALYAREQSRQAFAVLAKRLAAVAASL